MKKRQNHLYFTVQSSLMIISFLFFLPSLILLESHLTFAEDSTLVGQPLEINPEISPSTWHPQQSGELRVELKLPPGYRAYGEQFRLKLVDAASESNQFFVEREPSKNQFKLGSIQIQPLQEFYDETSKKRKKGVIGSALLTVLIESPEKLDNENDELEFALTYQACTATFCLFPKEIRFKLPIEFIPSSENSIDSDGPSGTNFSTFASISNYFSKHLSLSNFQDLFSKGLFISFIFVFIAGVLTSFTPCIFPMIPITMAILGGNSYHHRKKRHTFLLSFSYVIGIALTYSLLGIFAATTGALFGSYMSHPIVLSFVCLVFLVMSLSMFGLFDLQMPLWMRNKLLGIGTEGRNSRKFGSVSMGANAPGSPSGDSLQSKGDLFAPTYHFRQYGKAFLSGAISGLVASPCVGPVLVGILTYVAKTQDVWLGFWLLFVFAFGMGQLFLLIGLFSHFTQWLPRSGSWMEGVKKFFAFMMLVVFFYYLKLLIPEPFFVSALAGGAIFLGLLFGPFNPANTSPVIEEIRMWRKIRKVFSGILLGVGVIGLMGSLVLFRDKNASENSAFVSTGIEWNNYSDEILKKAQQEGRPLIIDFFAEWCASCKELDHKVFSHQGLQLLATQFVLVKFDATKDSPQLEELKKKYEIYGLPTVVFINGKGEWIKELTLTEVESPVQFMERMNKALKIEP